MELAQAPQQKIWADRLAARPNGIVNQAIVRAFRGQVPAVRINGKWWQATVGTEILEGAVVRTARDSMVELLLKENGPIVRVREDSSIKLVRLRLAKNASARVIDTMIELHRGQVIGYAFDNGPASSYLIRSPYGTASIERGCFSYTERAALKTGDCVATNHQDNAPTQTVPFLQSLGDPPYVAGSHIRECDVLISVDSEKYAPKPK